ncbi:hypothetical protein FQA39_LY10646 [Lamprigera yunnana]|nr:hypothetical protein FQA39_LY10646 [Lamprigera yunnana]
MCKPHWLYGNFHRHFLKAHIEGRGVSSNQENTISKNFKLNTTKSTNIQSDISNILTDCQNRQENCSSLSSSLNECPNDRIKTLHSIQMKNFVALDESPEIQVELNALDYPNVKKQPIEVSMLSVTDDMTNKIDQRFNNESAKETTPPSTILSMNYSETDSYVYCGNENLDLNKKTTDCQSASCSKWSTLKYGRNIRKRRKREKFNENQSLIISFFPVVGVIMKTIDNITIANMIQERLNENMFIEFCANPPTYDKASSISSNDFFNKLASISNKNNDPKRKNQFENSIKKFSVYLFYTGGRLLYETLHANLNGVLPSITALYRFTAHHGFKITEGEINFRGLSNFLNERGLPRTVWMSEDATRTTGKIQYDSATNSSDGDTRLLKAMKIAASLPSAPISRKWFHMDLSNTKLCYFQDQVHVLTKLRTRLLKPGISVPIGHLDISVTHLNTLIRTVSKDKHLLTPCDLAPEDKMNYESARKICEEKVLHLLENSPYLKVTLPNKTIVIKKSAYCWLLDTGNGKISSDRLKRFIVTKRKEPTTDTKESKKEKLKKFRKVKESESDSNSDGEIEYDDSTNTDVENFSCDDAVQSPFTIELEKYYAVQYEEQWYIGRVISRSEENFYVMKFLKQEVNVFVWPKNINTDISKVHESYIFYGPIDLI